MRTNKYIDHLVVIPEDDANFELANSFILSEHVPLNRASRIELLRPKGGWLKTLDFFRKKYAPTLNVYSKRRVLILIDFDDEPERPKYARNALSIPKAFAERVFILGSASDPEHLRRSLNRPLEQIGKALAQDCLNNTNDTWGHDLIRHNADEVARMRKHVRDFLFQPEPLASE